MEDLLREAFQLGQQWVQDMDNDQEPTDFNTWYNSDDTQERVKNCSIPVVGNRTFIVEEKIAGTCYWESLSVEFDNIEQAKHFYNRHFEKYSENIRLIEVYAR